MRKDLVQSAWKDCFEKIEPVKQRNLQPDEDDANTSFEYSFFPLDFFWGPDSQTKPQLTRHKEEARGTKESKDRNSPLVSKLISHSGLLQGINVAP